MTETNATTRSRLPGDDVPAWDSLSEADIEFYLRRGRRLRAEQAGVVFAGLKRRLEALLGDRETDRTCAGHPPLGATAPRAAR